MKFEVISVKKTIGSPGKIIHTWGKCCKNGGDWGLGHFGGNSDLGPNRLLLHQDLLHQDINAGFAFSRYLNGTFS